VARRSRIAEASAALDGITTSLLDKGGRDDGFSSPLTRTASSALWVGSVRSSVPSSVSVFADRFEFEFLYPRRGKSVRMVMRFSDMTGMERGGPRSGRRDSRAAAGAAWLAFSVRGALDQFSGDGEAASGPSGARGRVMIEFGVGSALGVIAADVVPRAPGLARLWAASA